MRISAIICIFGLLFLASCQKETFPDLSTCHKMTISDALPVQFWLSGCDTYNETVPKGVHEQCICMPWQCDDEINVQFLEETGGEYSLQIKNSEGTILQSLDFIEVDDGVYHLAFIPEDYDICDETVNFVISGGSPFGDEILSNPEFTSTLEPWENVTGSGADWSLNTGAAQVSIGTGTTSDPLRQDFTEQPAGTYRFEWAYDSQGPALTAAVRFEIKAYLSGSLVQTLYNETDDTPSIEQFVEDITVSGAFDRIEIVAEQTGTPSGAVFRLFHFRMKAHLSPSELAQSDCLHIATSHDETELFEYYNERDFAGLKYPEVSPEIRFAIRVPCRFFHEVFPEEDEAIELTSSIVTTSAQLKSQKMLEVKHVPYYFHKKLQLILKHHTLTHNGISYKKEEKYEIIPGNKQWPLKPATCLLTEKNSVLRNIL